MKLKGWEMERDLDPSVAEDVISFILHFLIRSNASHWNWHLRSESLAHTRTEFSDTKTDLWMRSWFWEGSFFSSNNNTGAQRLDNFGIRIKTKSNDRYWCISSFFSIHHVLLFFFSLSLLWRFSKRQDVLQANVSLKLKGGTLHPSLLVIFQRFNLHLDTWL